VRPLLLLIASLPLLAADVDSVLQSAIGPKGVPGIVAMVATRDRIVYQGAKGNASIQSVFRLFSMTKPITSVAAMQLVEQGKLELNAPVGRYIPELAHPQILVGYDASKQPILKPAAHQPTVRQLLSHTSGYGYSLWDEKLAKYADADDPMKAPLVFEPGSNWEYGVSTDIVGHIVERVSGQTLEEYFQQHIFRRLGMSETTYFPNAALQSRLMKVAERLPDGSYRERQFPVPRQIHPHGSGGLFSTAADYVNFMQLFLRDGKGVLQPSSVQAMRRNQIGALTVRRMISMQPAFSRDFGFHIEAGDKFGLGFQINPAAYPNGRSAKSMAWAGLWNTFFWIDPDSNVCAVLLMQSTPFFDPAAVRTLTAFETAVYGMLRNARKEIQ